MHICGPESDFAYSPGRIYTPPDALLPDYLHLAGTLGLERVVFVQPSIYGSDNTAMLQAMTECPLTNRGIAVLNASVSDAELASLHEAGVRGVRFNLVDVAEPGIDLPLSSIVTIGERIQPLGWHVELLVHVDDFPNLEQKLGELPLDIVVGHLGYCRPGRTPADPGFQALLRLMKTGRCWTKLTGPYRVSTGEFPYSSARPFAETLMDEACERLLWGSDWPHVMLKTAMPNDGDLLELFFDWTGSDAVASKILVENPSQLYGF